METWGLEGESSIKDVWLEILNNRLGEQEGWFENQINKTSAKNEHMLAFIFEYVTNNKNKKNFKINYKSLIKKFTSISSAMLLDDPLCMGIERFEIINEKMKLDKEDWKRIIDITDKRYMQDVIKNKLITKLNKIGSLKKEEQIKFMEYVLEPLIESMKDDIKSHNGELLLSVIVDLMLKKEIPRIKDNILTILINSGEVKYALKYLLEHDIENVKSKDETYLKYISKENAELIIENTDIRRIDINNLYLYYGYKSNAEISKELRDKIYKKFIRKDKDYVLVHLNVGDTGWTEEFIDEKILNISKSDAKSEEMLMFWIKDIKKQKEMFGIWIKEALKDSDPKVIPKKERNSLNHNHLKQLVDAIEIFEDKSKKDYENRYIYEFYQNRIKNEDELGYKLLKEIKENNFYELRVPFLKDLLNKRKLTNEYLINYYFDESFDNILNITEEEFINYIKDSKTNEYKYDLVKKCFNCNNADRKKTGNLLSFCIDSINKKEEKESIEVLKEWYGNIKHNPRVQKKLTYSISKAGIEKIITNKKLLKLIGQTVLTSINKIEDIWNININKEALINEIDINALDFNFKYSHVNKVENVTLEKAQEYGITLQDVDKYTRIGKGVLSFQKDGNFNFWNELINQKTKDGKETFSNEVIKILLDKIDLKNSYKRAELVESLFDDFTDPNNNKFIKKIIKEEEKYFELLVDKIIEQSNDEEITRLTQELLNLRVEIYFNEEIIMRAYDKSNKKEIEPELLKKAQIVSLMKEEDLNNIDVAYNLISKNKDNFYKLGKQLIEFLQLDKENSEKVLRKYNEKNIEGLFGYFKRKEKEELQEKINKAIEYNNKQQLNPIKIKEEIERININRLYEQEKEQVENIINKLMTINKDILKELPLTENTELKKCMETTFIGIIKTYSKISDNDKKENPELMENFKDIMNYCEAQIDKIIPKVQIIKAKI